MNLKEFIDFRQHCPICQGQLVNLFHSSRKQTVKIEEHRFLVFFALIALDGKSGQKPHTVVYSFDLSENLFQIEFYSRNKKVRYETVHDSIIKLFLALHSNL